MERPLTSHPDVTIRPASEADHARLARLLREWWDERPPRLERVWFRHFAPTSVVAVTGERRPLAFAVAFPSDALPGRGVLWLVAVSPAARRRGLGRAVAGAALRALVDAGSTIAEAAVWPGNRVGVRFLEALGFAPVPESLATPLYGVPALADYDGDGEDRAVMELRLRPAPG